MRFHVKKLLQCLAMLGVNAVPALGWFVGGWSAGTMLAIYWFENVVACLFVTVRIWLHSRLVPSHGHFQHKPRNDTQGAKKNTFWSGFMIVSLFFSAAHGIMLAAILFVLTKNGKADEIGVNWSEVGTGCRNVAIFLVMDFLASLPGLRKKTFLEIERVADWNLGRVFLVHLTIIFGMLGVALTGATKAFFAVFMAMKTLGDLGTIIPQWQPKAPPVWLCRIMDKVPNARKGARPGETFAEFWKKDDAAEQNRRLANERSWTGR
jgi:Family of unknown function (DUF6498)